MNGNDILNGMEHIDPKLIESAEKSSRTEAENLGVLPQRRRSFSASPWRAQCC